MSDRANPFEWSGGHPALDLVNTWMNALVRADQNLVTFRDLTRFAELAGLVDRRTAARLQRPDSRSSSSIVKSVRKLREHLHDVLAATNSGRSPRQSDLDVLSTAIQAAHAAQKLVAVPPRPGLADRRWSPSRACEIPLHACSLAIECLLVGEERKRIRKCEAPDCDVYYLDTSKGQRRQWCSMRGCGNREKQGGGALRHDRIAGLSHSNGRWRGNELARLIDIRRRLVHRLHHLDSARVTDVRQCRGERLVGDERLDLADMGDADRGAAAELCGVRHQHDVAGVGDDGLRHLHFAIVEIQQRALLVDRRGPDDGVVDLELADQLRRGRADDCAIGRRTAPPATTTSMRGWRYNSIATLRLLVMTSRSSCEVSALATSSVVVPMLMNSEQPFGIPPRRQPQSPFSPRRRRSGAPHRRGFPRRRQ